MQYLTTIACVFSTGVWVFVGLYKLTHRKKMIEVIRAHHIPLPEAAYWLSMTVELGGACFMLFQQAIWAVVLAWLVFLCIATPIFHGAVVRDRTIDYHQLVHVGKNFSIAGGLIALLIIDGTLPQYLGWAETPSRAAIASTGAKPSAALAQGPSSRE